MRKENYNEQIQSLICQMNRSASFPMNIKVALQAYLCYILYFLTKGLLQ